MAQQNPDPSVENRTDEPALHRTIHRWNILRFWDPTPSSSLVEMHATWLQGGAKSRDPRENSRTVFTPVYGSFIHWTDELKNIFASKIESETKFSSSTEAPRLQFLDQSKHGSFPLKWKFNRSRMLREAKSEQQVVSDKIVRKHAGDTLKWHLQELLCDLGGHPQNGLPLHTASNLCTDSNILLSVLPQASAMSTNAVNNLCTDFMEDRNTKMASQTLEYSTSCNPSKHKDSMPRTQLDDDDTFNLHKREEPTNRATSLVIFLIVYLLILLATPSIHRQPLQKERRPMSVWVPLLELFSFVVFVWAVLVGKKITRMHSALFLFWTILMHSRSDISVNVLFLPIICFIGWSVLRSWKSNNQMEGYKLSSAVNLQWRTSPDLYR